MKINLRNNNIIFGQTSKKENPFDSDKVKKDFPNAANTDFAAALSIGAAALPLIDIGAIKLKKAPQFIIGSSILIVAGLKLDSFIGNKIKEKFKDTENKSKKIQFGYDVGISSLIFPSILNLVDKTNTYKIKLLDPNHLKENGLSRNKMLGIFVGVGAIIGTGVALYGKKINHAIAKYILGFKKEEN